MHGQYSFLPLDIQKSLFHRQKQDNYDWREEDKKGQ